MLTPAQIDALRRFDACTISDAIEQCGVRLRNEGFARPGLRSLTVPEARLVGYAATFRMRSSEPPIQGGAFLDRTDWWDAIARMPLPRIAVIRDMDPQPVGSCVGEIHAALFQALRCDGVITNGAVRDLPGIRKLGLPVFARHVAVSHAYTHVVDYGGAVEILGLEVRNGDLLFADCHGVVAIPSKIAASIAGIASEIRNKEERIVAACQTPGLSNQELLHAIRGKAQ
jgi:regulator of RNase E activity RraA